MPFKKIVCVLSHAAGDAAAMATAFGIARPAEGHVQVLSVRTDPHDSIPMLGEGVSAALVQEIMSNAERENTTRAETARRLFEEQRLAAGATLADAAPGPGGLTASWADRTGRAEAVVVKAARLADLTVFPHLQGDGETDAVLMLEAALMSGGRPLLVAPPDVPASVGRRVAIAWNGGAEAARAVGFALGTLSRADSVHILTAATSKTDPAGAAELADYLAWHGVRAELRDVVTAGETVGAALLRTVQEVDADLLVMGGYGTSRLRELILGGVTRHVLNNATCPVLMAH